MREYVLGFVFDKSTHDTESPVVLLILKDRPAKLKGMLNGIGGKINGNETPIRAMMREAKEESNLEFLDWIQFGKLINKSSSKIDDDLSIIHLFTAFSEGLDGVDNKEDSEVNFPTPLGYLPFYIKTKKCMPNLAYLVPAAYNRVKGFDKTFITLELEDIIKR